MVLRDSYIEAVAVATEATLTGRLAQFGGRPVANLALRDYGPLQQLAVLKRFGLPLEPEVVAERRYGIYRTAAQQLTASNGARFVLLYVPSKFRVYGEFVEPPSQSDLNDWRPNDLPARLEAMLRSISTEIGFVDLTEPFVREAANGRLLYFHDDTHWTEEGHLVAAEVLWTFLSEWESMPSP